MEASGHLPYEAISSCPTFRKLHRIKLEQINQPTRRITNVFVGFDTPSREEGEGGAAQSDESSFTTPSLKPESLKESAGAPCT